VTTALSVLVPVHRWEVAGLVRALAEEAAGLAGEVRIHLLDDGTPNAGILAANRAAIAALPADQRACLSYEELPANVGRSAVRNLLASRADGNFLLFLDCDVMPDEPGFLGRYLETLRAGAADVVCGGISYRQRIKQGRAFDFYLYVSGRNDARPAAERNRVPWRHLLTGNVALSRSAFLSTPFDERFLGHGYEDTEWAIRLGAGHRILHIDNTVSHLGLIEQRSFIERSRASMGNFARLARKHPEAMGDGPIWPYVRRFVRMPLSALHCIDMLLYAICLAHLVPRRGQYFAFQLDKAVLLARELRRHPAG
jgi:hypothetical protein